MSVFSPSLRALIGEAGYRTVIERFSIDAMVRRVQEVYDQELARAGVVATSGTSAITEPHDPSAQPGTRAALEVPPI